MSLAMMGCNYTLARDNPSAAPNVVAHCEGSENVDDSSVAVVPIPVVAFLSPHADLHQISATDYVNRCGPGQLVNREVTLSKSACIPASLTEILTLGIWQWCPASVAWSADVVNPNATVVVPSPSASLGSSSSNLAQAR